MSPTKSHRFGRGPAVLKLFLLPLSQPDTGATTVLDEPTLAKARLIHRNGRPAHCAGLYLSFLLGRLGGLATDYLRPSGPFSRAGGFCNARRGDLGKADARLITVCELDASEF
jgi:hypothetical protein